MKFEMEIFLVLESDCFRGGLNESFFWFRVEINKRKRKENDVNKSGSKTFCEACVKKLCSANIIENF